MWDDNLAIVRSIRRMLVEAEPRLESFLWATNLPVHGIRVRCGPFIESRAQDLDHVTKLLVRLAH